MAKISQNFRQKNTAVWWTKTRCGWF